MRFEIVHWNGPNGAPKRTLLDALGLCDVRPFRPTHVPSAHVKVSVLTLNRSCLPVQVRSLHTHSSRSLPLTHPPIHSHQHFLRRKRREVSELDKLGPGVHVSRP